MNSKQKYLRIAIASVPLIVFAIAMTQVAFKAQHNEVETTEGYSAFLAGGIAILGGGLFEWFTWLANPIALWAWLKFLAASDTAPKINPITKKSLLRPQPIGDWRSVLAAAIALSFSLWNKILVSESGSAGEILSFGLGYWLWATSLILLAIGINYYYYKYQKTAVSYIN